jgi:hypothetical protein
MGASGAQPHERLLELPTVYRHGMQAPRHRMRRYRVARGHASAPPGRRRRGARLRHMLAASWPTERAGVMSQAALSEPQLYPRIAFQ